MVSIKEVSTLIVCGDGINAEVELGNAFLENGSTVNLIHINELLDNPKLIHDYHIIGFPGGFSFGDEIRSGKVFAIKVQNTLLTELHKFVENKKLIIGICNGFQILMQLDLFSENQKHREMTLSINNHHEFRNFWTKVEVSKNKSPWLLNINGPFYLPVRHKEGRLFGELEANREALTYSESINGAIKNIAGITNQSGNVFGLMPHPEAARFDILNPADVPAGNAEIVNLIFKNGINYIKKEFINAGLN